MIALLKQIIHVMTFGVYSVEDYLERSIVIMNNILLYFLQDEMESQFNLLTILKFGGDMIVKKCLYCIEARDVVRVI